MVSLFKHIQAHLMIIIALFICTCFSPITSYSADVDVYLEGTYTESDLVVDIYADINSSPLVSFGLRIEYPAGLVFSAAAKNETVWYFGDGAQNAPYVEPQNTDPAGDSPGSVVFIGGKFDTNALTAGVSGPGVLLGSVSFTHSGFDFSADPNPISVSYAHGTGTIDDTFKNFVATDGTVYDGDGVAFAVSISEQAVPNNPPVATDDTATLDEDSSATISVLANDTDSDGDPLTAALVTGPAYGALTLNTDGSFAYTPNQDFFGTDSFTYMANDGSEDSNVATVSITINAVNDAPVAINDSYNSDEDMPLSIPVPGLLGNDTDVESDTLSAILVTVPSHGTLNVNAEGSFTYSPTENYNGTDTFTYRANDGSLDSNDATVTITINAINDAPQIGFVEPSQNLTTAAVQLQIRWEDSDPDSSALISLYYDSDDSGQDGTLIVSGLSEDADLGGDAYLWDTSALADGTFYLYAVIADEVSTTASYATVSITIDRTAPQLTVTPAGGTFTAAQSVVLTTDEPADIFFTLDGSAPTTSSTPYTTPITIDQTATLRALAKDTAGNECQILTAVYTIQTITNTPPVADAGSDVTVSMGETAEVDGSASHDPDNGPQPLSYAWSIVSVPAGSSITGSDLTGADTALCTFTPDTAGDYVLSLTVSDGQAESSDEVTVTCQADEVPGDLDGDGVISSSDYMVFRSTLGKCTGDAGFIAAADYDGDGCVTYTDYSIWYGYYRNQ